MFQLLDAFVQRVGEKNVVQVVTDSASNNVFAGKKLEEKYPNLYWTPCAAHCLDLMFEDIFKLPELKRTLEREIQVNGYIYNHTVVLNMMREFTGNKEMVRTTKTRFDTAFLTLRRFRIQQTNLRKMFTSSQWTTSKFAKECQGRHIASIMLMPIFWRNVLYSVKLGGPLVEVLRLVDGEKKPQMGYIYEDMDKAKEKIDVSFNKNEDIYKENFEIIDKRWNCQLHRPLHVAGYFLNPQFFYSNKEIEEDEKVMNGLYECMLRLDPSPEIQDAFQIELPKYTGGEGVFGMPINVRQRANLSPAVWWANYGSSTPNLRRFAIKVLSLICGSSSCKRNWSIFEPLHSKKRNRLEQRKLNDLVFIKYNRALRRRYDMRDSIDPIILDEVVDDGNKWVVGRMEESDEEDNTLVHEDDDLTWSQVARASGVNEPYYPLRSATSRASREASSSKKNSTFTSSLNLMDEDDNIFDEEDGQEEERDCDGYKSANDEDNDKIYDAMSDDEI